MKILEFKNISRKNHTIHYRREFSGSVVLEDMAKKFTEKRLEFVLEHGPTGTIDIQVNLLEDIDYPLLPLLSSLKGYISDLDKKGRLP